MSMLTQLKTMLRRYTSTHSAVFLAVVVLLLVTLALNQEPPEHCPEYFSPLGGVVFSRPTKLAASPKCPNPFFADGKVDAPFDRSGQVCTPLTGPSASFLVSVCRDAKAPCNQFSVRIRRSDQTACAEAEQAGPRVKSAGLADVLRANGPDTFLLRTNGAQRWVTEKAVYEGSCTYRFDVTLHNGGTVWLELWWLYEHYQYMNELDWDKWPPCKFEALLDYPVRLNICPAGCPTWHAPRMRDPEPQPVLDGTNRTYLPLATVGGLTEAEIPNCPLDGIREGVWLPLHEMDHVVPPIAFQGPSRGQQPLFTGYRYVPRQCRFRHGGTVYQDHSACRSNKRKVMFYGDSHARYTMVGFLYRMEGNIDAYPDNDHGVRYQADQPYMKTYTFDQLTIDWVPDHDESKINHLSTEYLVEHQGVVVSTGAWNAMSGWALDDFAKYVIRLLDRFPSSIESRVYMVPAPFPPQTSGVPVERHEHRTNWQLDQYRSTAIRIATERGWRIVNQYERGMPVMLEMLAADALHLSPGAAQESIIDEVLAKLEIC